MERLSVNSSNISSIGYDPSTKTLEIAFISGGIYQYYNVPISVFNALMAADSHGKYFSANIRNRYGDTRVG